MDEDPRAELTCLVRELGTGLRTLRDFGVQLVKPRSWRPEPAEPVQSQPAPAEPGGRAQAHLFAPAPPARQPLPDDDRPGWRPNPLSAEQAQAELDDLRRQIGDCTRCGLSRGRRQLVFGEGNPVARLALVGEGPGGEEDRSGRPFVGPAGQLLERILSAMGLTRQQVYICNVVKCRPPQNRTPAGDEMRTCGQFLARQLSIVHPRHILALGGTAAGFLLNRDQPMGKLRGRFFDHPETGARIMPTYHPAYLLRNDSAKRMVWEDVQRVMAEMRTPGEGEGG